MFHGHRHSWILMAECYRHAFCDGRTRKGKVVCVHTPHLHCAPQTTLRGFRAVRDTTFTLPNECGYPEDGSLALADFNDLGHTARAQGRLASSRFLLPPRKGQNGSSQPQPCVLVAIGRCRVDSRYGDNCGQRGCSILGAWSGHRGDVKHRAATRFLCVR